MNSSSTNELMRALIDLQDLDHEVGRIQRRMRDGPRLVERRTEGLRQAEAKLGRAQETVKQRKAEVAELELELKSKEGEIQKLAGQQGSAKTNQEYRALGDHMERIRATCGELEDRILEAFTRVEEAEEETKIHEQARTESAAEAKQIQDAWSKDEGEYQQELDRFKGRRDELCQTLPKGPLQVYEKVLEAYDGKAVVPVEGKVCSGCHMAVTPNDLARLHQVGGELITCRSCGRILFIPEVHQARG